VKEANSNVETHQSNIEDLQRELDEAIANGESQIESHNDAVDTFNVQIEDLNTQLSIQLELNESATSKLAQYNSQIELVAEMVEGGDTLAVDESGDDRENDELTMLQEKILGRLREESAKQEVQVAAIGKRATDSETRVAEVCLEFV
jgi:phage gp36-like protein